MGAKRKGPPGTPILRAAEHDRPARRAPVNQVWTIVLKCAQGHQHVFNDNGKRKEDMLFAGLLNGTCESSVYRPTQSMDSVFGQCGICGARIHCEIKVGRGGLGRNQTSLGFAVGRALRWRGSW
jgi:hypothetical protein